ncbi:MAG: cupin domain-containing protein [Bacteroidota bacterium]
MDSSNTKWVLGHKITPHETSGDYDLMVAETPPNVPGPPPHLHNAYKESFLIIEGELEFFIDGKTRVVKAGESVDVPPKTLHTFNNKSDQPCKWVNIHSPKGFRKFFDELGIPENEDNAIEKSIAESVLNKVITAAADYDMIIRV